MFRLPDPASDPGPRPSPHARARRRLQGSRLRLRGQAPFFGAVALFAELSLRDGFGTAGTDGRRIIFDPRFVEALSTAELDAVMLHEVLHAALLHAPRRGWREPWRWNVACDIVVNAIVVQERWVQLPAGAIIDESLEGQSAEEIYELLPPDPPDDRLGLDLVLDPSAGSPESDGARHGLREHWSAAIAQASAATGDTLRGDLPAGWVRDAAMVVAPPLDWRRHLWRFAVRTPSDFRSFDRRMIHRGLYLEALEAETLVLEICVDTSGSIDSHQLGRFLNELRALSRLYPHLDARLYYADAALHGPFSLDEDQPPIGGGGTSFVPFFDMLAESLSLTENRAAIYFTDGHGELPADPSIDTLWVVPPGGRQSGEFPFGEVVRLVDL